MASVRFEQDGNEIKVESDGPPPESVEMFFLSKDIAENHGDIGDTARKILSADSRLGARSGEGSMFGRVDRPQHLARRGLETQPEYALVCG